MQLSDEMKGWADHTFQRRLKTLSALPSKKLDTNLALDHARDTAEIRVSSYKDAFRKENLNLSEADIEEICSGLPEVIMDSFPKAKKEVLQDLREAITEIVESHRVNLRRHRAEGNILNYTTNIYGPNYGEILQGGSGHTLFSQVSIAKPSISIDEPKLRSFSPPRKIALAHVVGRQNDFNRALRLLKEGVSLTISGSAGTGKTTMGIMLHNHLVENGALAIWYDAEIAPTTTGLFSSLSEHLGLEKTVQEQDVIAVLQETSVQSQVYLFIDNYESVLRNTEEGLISKDVRDRFQRSINDLSSFLKIVILSRVSPVNLPSESDYVLRGVERRHYLSLFRQYYVGTISRSDHPIIRDICDYLDGNPLWIKIAAPLISRYGYSFAQLLEELRLKGPDVLIPSDFVEQHGVPLKGFSRSLDMSFGLLPITTRHVFMVLSLWKGAFSYEILEKITMSGSPTLRKDFYNLIDANLIDQVEGGAVGQFRFMPMVNQYAERKYAQYLSSHGEEYSREMHNKCLLLNNWGKQHNQGWTSGAATIDIPNLDIFAANAYDSIVRALAAKKYDDMMLVWEMFWRILELFIDPSELSKLGGYAFDYAAEVGNLPACAWTAVNSLGYSFLITGDFESALRGLKKGIEIGQKCKDHEAVAAGFRHLGRISIYKHDYAAAENLYLKSLESAKSARPDERVRHEAASFSGLARVYLEQKKLDLAEDYSNQAITILRKINDLSRLSAALLGLGTCYLIRSRTAREYIEKAKVVLQESASFRRREITGQALMGLAEAEWMSGHKTEAIGWINKAVEVLESVQAIELAKAKDLRESFTRQYP